MGTLPRFWVKTSEPEAGVYELKMLSGLDDWPRERVVLYVCENLNGYLSESFTDNMVAAGTWRWATEEEVIRDGGVFGDDDED